MGKLAGKVAVITGGTSGIGHAAVRLFIDEGSRVVIADIQDDKGRRLAEELGACAAYVHADVSREADVKAVLELHDYRSGEPYYLGVFLVGAYQEILGDLHNLFGDTNTVHVALDPEEDYTIEGVVNGDTVADVLRYVRYNRDDLVARVRKTAENALRAKRITFEESKHLLRRYEEGLSGYTYLEQD